MPDIFDEIEQQGDVFDSVTPQRSVGGFMENLFRSGKKQVGGLGHMITHPVETYQALAPVVEFATGVGTGSLPSMAKSAPKAKKFADAVIDDYAKAYGSWDAVKETLYNDPMRVVGDAAMLFGGAGAAAKAANLPRVARAAQAVEGGLNAVQPVNIVASAPGAIVKAGAKMLPATAPRGIYRSALQPKTLGPRGDVPGSERANQMIDLAVEGEYLPGQVAPVAQRMDDLNQARDAAIAHAPGTIDPQNVVARADELAANVANRSRPTRPLRVIQNMKEETLAKYADAQTPESLAAGAPPSYRQVSPAEAQATKSADYAESYIGGGKTIRAQTGRQIARGWKEELESLVPELKAINPEWAGLKDLYDEFERFAQKAHGASATDLGVAATVGAVTGGPAGSMTAAGLREVISSPAIKAKLAFALKKAQREGFKGRGLGSATAPTIEIADILRQIEERDKAQQEKQ